ncbi:MAG: methylamine dehydrogenase heavy chain [Hyphomicrobiaceae bacterium]|jgi:methylamine dehydrogenase heavy chain
MGNIGNMGNMNRPGKTGATDATGQTEMRRKSDETRETRLSRLRHPFHVQAPLFALPLLALVVVAGTVLAGAGAASAELEADPHGIVASLPDTTGDHWVWVADRIFQHSLLFDGDDGNVLGAIDTNFNIAGRAPLGSRVRGEFYMVESVYARGHYGERSDFVTIYDSRSLGVVGEIKLPIHTAEAGHGVGLVDVLDEGRFLVVFSQNPTAAVGVVDLIARRFVATIDTAGCAGVYPTGPASFIMLCGNGTAMAVQLDETGESAALVSSEPFFDVVEDPITEKGVRDGSKWLFASFDGWLHEVETSGDVPSLSKRWSLFSDSERADGWRIGGVQHLSLHRDSGRLYSLVHQGGPGSHKDPGFEIRVYDSHARTSVATYEAPGLVAPFLRPYLDLESDSFAYRAISWLLPSLGAHSVVVTQDAQPLLFVRHSELGAIGVLDALTGEHVRNLEESGISGGIMALP